MAGNKNSGRTKLPEGRKRVSLRVPMGMYKKIEKNAKAKFGSVHAEILVLLDKALKKEE